MSESSPVSLIRNPFRRKKQNLSEKEIDPFIRSTSELKADGSKAFTSFLNSFNRVDAIVGPHRSKKKCLAEIIELKTIIDGKSEIYSPVSVRILKQLNGRRQRSYYTSWRWAVLRGIRKPVKAEIETLTYLENHMKKLVPVSKEQVGILHQLRTNYNNAAGMCIDCSICTRKYNSFVYDICVVLHPQFFCIFRYRLYICIV